MRFRILLTVLLLPVLAAAERRQPNILLFLVDDMGLMDSSVPFLTDDKGQAVTHPLNEFYQTPAMEALARQGFRSSRFYANSVCSPTRVSLMTGQSSARHRTTQWISPSAPNGGPHDPPNWNWKGLDSTDVTLPRLLQQAGYRTIHCGKGHFGPFESEGANPQSIGFDINIGGGAIGRPSSYYGEDGYGHIRGTSSVRKVPGLEKYHGTGTFLTEALTLELNQEIKNAVADEKPFFAYMSHYAVHAPFQADARFKDHYPDAPENHMAYATLVEGIDRSLQDILAQLDTLGIAKNTLVIFLGDNGSDAPLGDAHGHSSSAPLRGKKGTHYEGGMRVPFIAAWAKPSEASAIQKQFPIAQGTIDSTHLGSIHDILPTLLELADVDTPEGHPIDGGSLWSGFSGKAPTQPQTFLMHFPHAHRSSYFTVFIDGEFKLVLHYLKQDQERHQLFNLSQDPYENHNLAASDPALLDRMLKAMRRELTEAAALDPVAKEDDTPSPPLKRQRASEPDCIAPSSRNGILPPSKKPITHTGNS